MMKKMDYIKNCKIFLDDIRIPKDAIGSVPDKHNKLNSRVFFF